MNDSNLSEQQPEEQHPGEVQQSPESVQEETFEPLLDQQKAEKILLALLFVSDSPVPVEKIVPVFESEVPETPRGQQQRDKLALRLAEEIEGLLNGLAGRLAEEDGPFQIAEVAGGYQLCTKEELGLYIDRFFERRRKSTLSGAALETLAIIAYQQPMTRAELEAMRGVNVDHMVHSLLEKRLIRVAGRKDVPGKPFMYRTTKFFLEYFGLSSLQELPKADDLREALERGTDPSRQSEMADVGFRESEDQYNFDNMPEEEEPFEENNEPSDPPTSEDEFEDDHFDDES